MLCHGLHDEDVNALVKLKILSVNIEKVYRRPEIDVRRIQSNSD
jgi:hypothetical protein